MMEPSDDDVDRFLTTHYGRGSPIAPLTRREQRELDAEISAVRAERGNRGRSPSQRQGALWAWLNSMLRVRPATLALGLVVAAAVFVLIPRAGQSPPEADFELRGRVASVRSRAPQVRSVNAGTFHPSGTVTIELRVPKDGEGCRVTDWAVFEIDGQERLRTAKAGRMTEIREGAERVFTFKANAGRLIGEAGHKVLAVGFGCTQADLADFEGAWRPKPSAGGGTRWFFFDLGLEDQTEQFEAELHRYVRVDGRDDQRTYVFDATKAVRVVVDGVGDGEPQVHGVAAPDRSVPCALTRDAAVSSAWEIRSDDPCLSDARALTVTFGARQRRWPIRFTREVGDVAAVHEDRTIGGAPMGGHRRYAAEH